MRYGFRWMGMWPHISLGISAHVWPPKFAHLSLHLPLGMLLIGYRGVTPLGNYSLAVHVEACQAASGNGYNGPWSYCGEDFQTGRRGQRIALATIWYCDVAQQYLPTAVEG
jgi:hypothetical protein